MSNRLASIEELPGTYRGFVEGVVRANLDLARSAISRLRRTAVGAAAMQVIPLATIKTKVYLTTTHQRVFFLFVRGPATDDVLLQLDIDFSVKAAPGLLDEHPAAPVRVRARIPPVFATGVDARQAALLSAKLNKEDRRRIVFLRAGQSILGVINPESMLDAKVARLEPGAAEAVVAFQRVATPAGAPSTFQYEPATFVRLLNEIAAWARAGKTTGALLEVPLPAVTSELPARKIVAATIGGWIESRNACPSDHRSRAARTLLPGFEVTGYRGEVVLRLQSNGKLAEKLKDDNFRLRLSVVTVEEGGAPWAEVSFDPPDFLVSGKLYQRLTETLRHPAVLRILVNTADIDKSLRPKLTKWIDDASRECFVFRAKKDGDRDTDVFVLKGDWDGVPRVVLAVVHVKVSREGEDDFSVRFIDEPESIQVEYTDIPGVKDRKSPRVPEYVLTLVHQLRNWLQALRGEA